VDSEGKVHAHVRQKLSDVMCSLALLTPMVSPSELAALESSLLNKSGNVPLHGRFRALFTLKALKSADAIRIISEGSESAICVKLVETDQIGRLPR
jgi:hypothetical protein